MYCLLLSLNELINMFIFSAFISNIVNIDKIYTNKKNLQGSQISIIFRSSETKKLRTNVLEKKKL